MYKLDAVLNSLNKMVSMNEKYSLISAYEPKIFIDSQREKYLSDLKNEIDRVHERKNHLDHEIKDLRESKEIIKRFKYDENYEKSLLNSIENCQGNIKHLKEIRIKLNEETKKLSDEHADNTNEIENTTKNIDKVRKQILILNGFLEKNKQYMQEWGKYNELIKEMKQLDLKISSAEDEINRLVNKNSTLSVDANSTSYQLDNIKKSLLIYSDAVESNCIEGSLEELEKEYSVLKEQQGRSIKDLENNLLSVKNQLAEKGKELSRINLELHEYEKVIFDEIKYDAILREIENFSDEKEKKQEDYNKATRNSDRSEEGFKFASQNLEALYMTNPIDKIEIKGNYGNRKKSINFELDKLKEKVQENTKKENLYRNYMGYIEIIVKVKQPLIASFFLKEDFIQQYNELKDKHENFNKEYETAKNNYSKLFNNIKNRYDSKHKSIADILNSIDTLNINDSTYDKMYYYYEELIKKRESLSKYLSFYEQQLQNIEHTKKQVIDQCVSYATLTYDDIKSIDLWGRTF